MQKAYKHVRQIPGIPAQRKPTSGTKPHIPSRFQAAKIFSPKKSKTQKAASRRAHREHREQFSRLRAFAAQCISEKPQAAKTRKRERTHAAKREPRAYSVRCPKKLV